MTSAFDLAVVVTNYNYAQFVGAAIESALDQDRVQVIAVDDGSTDESAAVLRRYNDRVEVVGQPNGGQGAAFNAGFARVAAPIVVFLDADDLLAQGMTARLVNAFRDPAVAKVQFALTLIDGAGNVLTGSMPPDPTRLSRGDLRQRLVVAPDDLAWQPTSGNAFRTSVLTKMLPMPTAPFRICADYYLSNLSAAHGTVSVLDEVGGSYRIHEDNNHFAARTTLSSLRANIVRTQETNRLLLGHCRQLGLSGADIDPSELRSVTALGHRLVSLRLDPSRHPVVGDTRGGLVRTGIEASLGRSDVGLARRLAMAGWFTAMGVAPRRLGQRLARPMVRVDQEAR